MVCYRYVHTNKTSGGGNMPIVQIDFAEGRSLDQKRDMAVKVTKAVCDSVNCPAEAVTIIMRELPRANFAKAGVLLSERK